MSVSAAETSCQNNPNEKLRAEAEFFNNNNQ